MTPPAELLHEYFKAMGSRGGKARRDSLTAKRRQEIASQGGKARARRASGPQTSG